MNWLKRFLATEKPASAIEAEESQEKLDVTIQATQEISDDVIKRAKAEIQHSEKIIRVAEQAIRSLKKVERQHQH